jgi:hypothetical protein
MINIKKIFFVLFFFVVIPEKYFMRNIVKILWFLIGEYYERNKPVFSTFRTQSAPDFAVAEHYGLRKPTCLYSKDVASGLTWVF